MSLADGLATALMRYLQAKSEHGLEALLLGRVSPDSPEYTAPQAPAAPAAPAQSGSERRLTQYKVKCPACSGDVAFEEGCVKCYACGFSQC